MNPGALSIVHIYRIEQSLPRGDYSSSSTIWFVDKEKAQNYVDIFKKTSENAIAAFRGRRRIQFYEEYALFDGERYFSIGGSLTITN